MRKFGFLAIAAAAGSCTMTPPAPSPAQVAQSQAKFAQLTGGKVAGAPMSCLPSYRSNDMVVIDVGLQKFSRPDGAPFFVLIPNAPARRHRLRSDNRITPFWI